MTEVQGSKKGNRKDQIQEATRDLEEEVLQTICDIDDPAIERFIRKNPTATKDIVGEMSLEDIAVSSRSRSIR